ATEYAADKSADGGQRGDKTGFKYGHAAFLHQVNGKPGKKKIGNRINTELREVHTQQHAVGQKLLYIPPLWTLVFMAMQIHIDQRAVFFDMIQFSFADPGMILGVIDYLEPDQRQRDAECAHYDKNLFPPERENNPAHQRR